MRWNVIIIMNAYKHLRIQKKNLNKNLTVELLASQIGLAPNYFIRVFRGRFHCTPLHYRMNTADRRGAEVGEWSFFGNKFSR